MNAIRPERIARILVLRPRALGDVLLVTPALRALKVGFPAAALDVGVDAQLAAIVERNPHVRQVWRFPRGGGWRAWWPIYHGIAHAGYDLVFDFHGSPRTAFLAAWSRAPHRFGFALRGRGRFYNYRVPRDADRDGIRRPMYAAQVNLEMVARCGVTGAVLEDCRLDLPPEAAAETAMESLLTRLAPARPRIGLAPAATWAAKTWPASQWARLGDACAGAGATVLLLWGPGERQVVERVRDAMRSNAIVLPPTDLNELAAMVARLDLVIAHDSGVRHVAVARATPSLCLYGPTDPRNWQPRFGPHAGIRAAVPCLGCNLTRCTHHLCMARLRPEAVAERALAMLESRSACGS